MRSVGIIFTVEPVYSVLEDRTRDLINGHRNFCEVIGQANTNNAIRGVVEYFILERIYKSDHILIAKRPTIDVTIPKEVLSVLMRDFDVSCDELLFNQVRLPHFLQLVEFDEAYFVGRDLVLAIPDTIATDPNLALCTSYSPQLNYPKI